MTTPEVRPLQRMRSITTMVMIGTVAGIGLFALALGLDRWWHLLVVLPAFVAAIWVTSRWHSPPSGAMLAASVVLTGTTWALSVMVGIDAAAVLPFAATAAIVVTAVQRHRGWVALAATVAGPATALLAFIFQPDRAGYYVYTAAVFMVVFVTTFWLNDVVWRLFTELDVMRRNESELAVVKERMRFASDLHDIQGHTLHVIKLKAAVAAKLQYVDPARVSTELADIERLTAETIEQAQHLVNSTRELSFTSELANAEALLTAAGFDVTVETGDGAPEHDELFALVLREATTNMLRHPMPGHAWVTIGQAHMTISNDGAATPSRPLRGLAALRERVASAGGKLVIDHEDPLFTLRLFTSGDSR